MRFFLCQGVFFPIRVPVRRRWTHVALLTALGLFMAGCIVSPVVENSPNDPRNPDVIDKVNAIDLLPHFQADRGQLATGSAKPSRPQVYMGSEGDSAGPTATPEHSATANGDGYDLNFENAPVSTIAKVIIGDILGAGYTIDPRVQGTVTLASGRAVAKGDIVFVLENALRMSNIALLKDRDGYRLVPLPDAVGGGAYDKRARASPGFGVSAVPLHYVSAQTALKLLDGFGIKNNSARVDASRNILLIQGTGSERQTAVDTVLNFDADWMRGQSVAIIPLRNSAPEAVVAELQKIMDSGEGGLGQNVVKLQPISRLNAILVVSSRPNYLTTARLWISRLDDSDTQGTNLKVYKIRYGNARQIASLLNDILIGRTNRSLETSASQIAPQSGLEVSSSQRGPLAALSALPPSSRQPKPDSEPSGPASSAHNASTGLNSVSSTGEIAPLPNVRITADVVNNSILVYANQESQRIVGQTLQQIDRPPLQVAIEATIAEVTLNDALGYGVQFYLNGNNLGLGTDGGSVINTLASLPLNHVFPGFNFLLGSEASPRLILDALHHVTAVKVLSNPSLVVLDNEAATLQVGDEVPVSTGTATVLTANNTVVNTISYRDTGIILRVTPRVSSNNSVVLQIEQEISNVASGSSATLTPTVSQRKVRSTVAVPNNQTVLLAGLISETQNKDNQGIPGLDELPLIGEAAGHKSNSRVRTELIIFIRPTVIRDAVDAHLVAEELRSKLRGHIVGTRVLRGLVTRPAPD